MKFGVRGFQAWLLQRLSAVYLAMFLLFVVISLGINPPVNYEVWHAWVTDPLVWTLWILFFVSLLLHAWVGIRDVILDYIHPLWLRFTMLSLVGLSLIVMAIWVFRIFLGLVLV
jgi:succinate dehydrogenase / fumarate reductase membrane anchor subunit